MRSNAATVDEYLADLPDERRDQIEDVRDVILANLPDGYVETMRWGMITYEIPLETYPDTYNDKPLMYAALASQKHYMALYLSGVYGVEGKAGTFQEQYVATGKKLDMGKSCVRFKTVDHLPLGLIGETIASLPPDRFIEGFEKARSGSITS